MERKGENPVKIIRWSRKVRLPSGEESNMQCRTGTMREVTEYARRVAEENGAAVEAVV